MDTSKKKVMTIIAIAIACLLAAGIAIGIVSVSGDRQRGNMLALARDYIARGDFDRALDILDRLIIKDANDKDARSLQDEALAGKSRAKTQADEAAKAGSGDTGALAQSLGELGKTLERTATTVAQSAGTKQAAASDSAASEAAAAAARKAEEDARAKAEAEAEAARKRAAEEELSRKSSELRAKMEAVNAMVKSGKESISAGDYTGAKNSFDGAVSSLPTGEAKFSAQTHADIAEGYYDGYKRAQTSPEGLESVKQAQRSAQEAIRNDSTDARPHYTLSKIYNDFQKPDLAVGELEQAVKLDPNNYLYAFELGKAYFKVKKYPEAQRAFESITTKLNPKYEPAFFNLGMTFRAMKNDTSALTAFGGAIKLKPDYVRAHIETARLLSAKRDAAGAIKSYQTALSFEPDNVAALRELGVVYSGTGKNAEAEKMFEKAMGISPDAATAYNLAKAKYDLGKAKEALPFAKKAVELAPAVALYHYQLGLVSEKAGDVDGALLSYAKAAELDRTAVDPRINLGRLYNESGFVDKALSVLEEAYKIDPRSQEVNNNLANAYSAKGMFDKSVFHYEAALALSPRDTTIRFNLAKAYVQSGELPKARDAYVELLKLSPSDWDAMFALGKVQVSMGDNAAAKKTFSDLLAKKPDFKSRAEVESIMAGL